ncbi:CPBP family intramembrane glutamic endopeptidase [Paenibacillus tyrfis]|uniref:CAAX prenyl protease 2/Lysostaphin resistance protein A-like domain-containing protein n=1 Tax=Paenibacillus tyrfis TaxID=1501230 RepID=A0A081P510_9BACL|nr:type II CAAX endopeptidase family protein [Paenibacillus tyrfis]KEQ25783.1 hypothetical protein ET33_03485 [Paenibacillus tyrfis]
MNRRYAYILIVFYLFSGPGPILFFLNKFTVSFLPIVTLSVILCLLKNEILLINFNQIIRNIQNYSLAFNGLKYCIFSHALSTLIFGFSAIVTDDLINSYLIVSVNSVIIAPIVEETVYRKIIFGFLNKQYNFWIGSIGSSFIFSIGHLNLDRFLAYFLVGMVLCFVYKKAGNLFPAMLAHASLNYISILVRTLNG